MKEPILFLPFFGPVRIVGGVIRFDCIDCICPMTLATLSFVQRFCEEDYRNGGGWWRVGTWFGCGGFIGCEDYPISYNIFRCLQKSFYVN